MNLFPTKPPNTFTVTLHRDGVSRPWGIRVAGGADIDTPIVVTKVAYGSPSEGELLCGDIIRKIGDYDARDIRHIDVQNLFKNAGSSVSLVVQREPGVSAPSSRCGSVTPSAMNRATTPVHGGVATPFAQCGISKSPLLSPPVPRELAASPHKLEVELEKLAVLDQPYRTSPLVLPGAKVKKDKPYTESYLRHHPNPAMRAAPGHYDPSQEVLMKQRVADTIIHRVGHDDGRQVVNKQYNTPIGLYSEKNIADSIQSQTGQGFGPTPDTEPSSPQISYPGSKTRYKKTFVYNPAKSETYKALQESEHDKFQEPAQSPVQPPVQTRVFSPIQSKLAAPGSTPNPNRASPQPHPTAPHPNANYTGVNSEEIHQSGSFKRLMHMVMTESY